jgi:hypothetical protein
LPRWDADAAQLSIKLTRTQVEQELAHLLGRPVVKPIDFRLAFPLDSVAGRRWISILSALLQTVAVPGGSPLARHQELIERSLICDLLVSQEHNYTERLVTGTGPRSPRSAVDRVAEHIQHAPDRGYSLADLAQLAGTSARSLQPVRINEFPERAVVRAYLARYECSAVAFPDCRAPSWAERG